MELQVFNLMKYYIEHDGTKVKLWFQSETVGKTLQECLDEIVALNLKYNQEEVDKLVLNNSLLSAIN